MCIILFSCLSVLFFVLFFAPQLSNSLNFSLLPIALCCLSLFFFFSANCELFLFWLQFFVCSWKTIRSNSNTRFVAVWFFHVHTALTETRCDRFRLPNVTEVASHCWMLRQAVNSLNDADYAFAACERDNSTYGRKANVRVLKWNGKKLLSRSRKMQRFVYSSIFRWRENWLVDVDGLCNRVKADVTRSFRLRQIVQILSVSFQLSHERAHTSIWREMTSKK